MITSPRPPRAPERRPPPPPGDDRQAHVGRARAFGAGVALLFLALVARLWFLQIVHGADYRQAAEANQARRVRTRAPRGVIVDRHGSLLAANRSRFAVYATPDILKNPPVLRRLAGLIGDTPEDITQTIQDTEQNPYDPLRIALDVPLKTITQVEENRPFLPGVSTEPEPVRWYPKGALAAHLLGTMGRIDPDEYKRYKDAGYFSDDFLGKTGIECAYESYLHGTPGGTDVQIDARGRRVSTLDSQSAVPGATVTLALDARVQAAAERVFRERQFTGAAVALDPRTGATLAMVSAPAFDPDKFAIGIKPADWKPLNGSPAHPLLNRALDAMYPPGSTFKPVVAAACLQTGALTTHSTAYCPGVYHLGRAPFHCWQVHGAVDFYRAIAVSCDVFFYIAGQRIGPERLAQYAKSFGLAEKTGIDMPGEDIGSIPSPAWKARRYARYGPEYSQWYGGDTLHMAIGQGDVLVTPLQMARVTASLANGGDVLQPYVVQKVTDGGTGKVVFQNERAVVRHVPVSPANMEAVRRGMRLTVTNGTGRVVSFPQVAVAAKTGSAQMHGQAKTHGWFICFAPYNHPTIAIAAVVEHGGHGADSAGKVARAMLQAYFHLPATEEESARSD
ncbi:MAG: penicillin-binding protein 2 [Armatimonadetes bacterium]|nr:penicillin-binding protein 2 [Armatimonadota bacterium]